MKPRKLRMDELDRPDAALLATLERHPLRVVVENVRSAFNVGAILRTADALRVEHVYLAGYTAPGDHRSVHRSALGAQDAVPWSHHYEPAEAIRLARSVGCTVVALEQTNLPTPVSRIRPSDYPLCLVVGNEVEGVSPESLEACDLAIELPQFGFKHSLNVSVAFGIAAYDLVRRWRDLRHPADEAASSATAH